MKKGHCLYPGSPGIRAIASLFGIRRQVIADMVAVWQEKNNTDEFPTSIKDLINNDMLELIGSHKDTAHIRTALAEYFVDNSPKTVTGEYYLKNKRYINREVAVASIAMSLNNNWVKGTFSKMIDRYLKKADNIKPDTINIVSTGYINNLPINDSFPYSAYLSELELMKKGGMSEFDARKYLAASNGVPPHKANNNTDSILFKQLFILPFVRDYNTAAQLKSLILTSEFKNNYRGPKDINGEPLLFFHADSSSREVEDRYGVHQVNGYWFTTSFFHALSYGDTLYPAFINTPNIIKVSAPTNLTPEEYRKKETELLSKALKVNGGKDVMAVLVTKDKEFSGGPTTQVLVKDSNTIIKFLPNLQELNLMQKYNDTLTDSPADKKRKVKGIFERYNGTIYGTFNQQVNIQQVVNEIRKVLKDKKVEYNQLYTGQYTILVDGKKINPFKDGNRKYQQKTDNKEKELTEEEKRINKKVEEIADTLGVEIILDDTIEDSGQLVSTSSDGKNKPLILVNPKLMREDTVLHEITHLVIDLLGGTNNKMVLDAFDEISKNFPNVVKEVASLYPELLTAENYHLFIKEVLATFIGEKGMEEILRREKESPLKTLFRQIVSFFREVFKINKLSAVEQILKKTLNPSSDLLEKEWDVYDIQRQKTKEEIHFDTLANDMKDRLIVMAKKYSKHKNNKTFSENINKLIEQLQALKSIQVTLTYTNNSIKYSDLLLKRLENYSKDNLPDEAFLSKAITYINAFDLIHVFSEKLSEFKIQFPESAEELDKIEIAIREAKEKHDKVLGLIKGYSKIILSKKLRPYYSKVDESFRKAYEREFNEYYGGKSEAKRILGDNYESVLSRHIEERMLESKDKRDKLSISELKTILEESSTEITGMELHLSGAFNINEDFIQVLTKLFESRDFNVKKQVIDRTNTLHRKFKAVADKHFGGDITKVYDLILEKDKKTGKPTGYFVGKYHSSFLQKKKEFFDNLGIKDKQKRKEAIKQFFNTAKKEYINQEWIKIQNAEGGVYSKELKDLYNEIRKFNEEREQLTPLDNTLSVREYYGFDEYVVHSTYKLPTMEKSWIEQVKDNGFFSGSFKKLSETFKITKKEETAVFIENEDKDRTNKKLFRKVLVDESGQIRKKIPLYFRGNLPIEYQSLDVLYVLSLEAHNIYNFAASSDLEHSILLLDDLYKSRQIHRKVSGVEWINLATGNTAKIKNGKESKNYEKFLDLIETRLYGIYTKDFGEIKLKDKSINLNKANNKLISWTALTMLGFNALAGGVNYLQSRLANIYEALGGEFFSWKDYRAAKRFLRQDSINIIKDINKANPEAITNLFAEYFDVFEDKTPLRHQLREKGLTKFMSPNSLFMFITGTEYGAQLQLLFSLLHKEKVYDRNKDTYIPMLEAYEVKNGKLVVKDGIDIPQELELEIQNRFKGLSIELHGNYYNNNRPLFKKTFLGSHVMLFRSWTVPLGQRRFRGFFNIFRNPEEADKFYSNLIRAEREGMYVTTIRYVYTLLLGDLTNLRLMSSTEWNKLSDGEKANIRKTVLELGTAILFYVAAKLIANAGKDLPEDEKTNYYLLAYLFRRTSAELSFYAGADTLDILATPATTTSFLKKLQKLTLQLFEPTERFSRGKHAGELKLLKYTGDITPGVSQFNREVIEAYKFIDK